MTNVEQAADHTHSVTPMEFPTGVIVNDVTDTDTEENLNRLDQLLADFAAEEGVESVELVQDDPADGVAILN